MRFALFCIALAACGGGTATTAPVETARPAMQKAYAIHLSRASHAGDRTHFVMDLTEDKHTRITNDAAVVEDKHDRRVLHYDAVQTVVAVDDRGRVTRSRNDVKELLSDGRALARGVVDIVRARKEEDAVVTVEGAPASKEVREALSALLNLKLGGASDDEVFGTKTPQPVGAHWPIDAQLAKADLQSQNGIEAASVTGDVWLEGLTRVGDADCLEVRARFGLDGIAVPGKPEGAVADSGHAEAEMRTALPIDGTPERASDHMAMTMSFEMRVPAPTGRFVNVALKLTQVRDARFSPM